MGTHALSSKDEQSHDFDTLFLLDLALFPEPMFVRRSGDHGLGFERAAGI